MARPFCHPRRVTGQAHRRGPPLPCLGARADLLRPWRAVGIPVKLLHAVTLRGSWRLWGCGRSKSPRPPPRLRSHGAISRGKRGARTPLLSTTPRFFLLAAPRSPASSSLLRLAARPSSGERRGDSFAMSSSSAAAPPPVRSGTWDGSEVHEDHIEFLRRTR